MTIFAGRAHVSVMSIWSALRRSHRSDTARWKTNSAPIRWSAVAYHRHLSHSMRIVSVPQDPMRTAIVEHQCSFVSPARAARCHTPRWVETRSARLWWSHSMVPSRSHNAQSLALEVFEKIWSHCPPLTMISDSRHSYLLDASRTSPMHIPNREIALSCTRTDRILHQPIEI